MPLRPLTKQQSRVLACIEESSAARGFPPTLREIGQAVGITSVNAVRGHVAALEKKGYIARDSDRARSIRVLQNPSALSRFRKRLHEIVRTDEGVRHRVVYGLGWMTAGRRAILTGPVKEAVERAFQRRCVEHGWTILETAVRPDHVRLVVAVWPNHSAETTVRRLKASAAPPGGAKRQAGAKTWRRGYVVTTDLAILDELIEQMLSDEDQTSST